ncbi:MAG: DUF1287 domain-containing protein [Ignavibacteria bacterium]|nr:DUF1287 domain-containing protein [Ignavibacteria bacterium]
MKSFLVLIFVFFIISCSKQEVKSDNTQSKQNKKSDSTQTANLTENQKKVLAGAKKCLEAKFSYDMTMGYYVLTYKDGSNTGSKVFPGGDMDPTTGVCTEVTVRALRWGGICDLQEEIYNDLKANFSDYPMSRWGAKKPDPNIDQRRVPNQMVWLEKHWSVVEGDNYQPGDVIAWDMNGDGWGDHIGIVSDKFISPTPTLPEGEGVGKPIPLLIHNFPDPGYVAEEDVLNRWEIIGHYRIK